MRSVIVSPVAGKQSSPGHAVWKALVVTTLDTRFLHEYFNVCRHDSLPALRAFPEDMQSHLSSRRNQQRAAPG